MMPFLSSLPETLSPDDPRTRLLVDALRSAPAETAPENRVSTMTAIAPLLLEEKLPAQVRDAAAIALLKMGCGELPKLADDAIQAVPPEEAGTLLYVLDKAGGQLSAGSALRILEHGSYESRAEALLLLGKGRLTLDPDQSVGQIRQRLLSLSNRENDPEGAEAGELALTYLDEWAAMHSGHAA